MSQKSFIFNQNCKDLVINFVFEGTYLLENKTLTLRIKLNSINKNTSFQYTVIVFVLIFISLMIFSMFILNYSKKRKKKILAELTIKY